MRGKGNLKSNFLSGYFLMQASLGKEKSGPLSKLFSFPNDIGKMKTKEVWLRVILAALFNIFYSAFTTKKKVVFFLFHTILIFFSLFNHGQQNRKEIQDLINQLLWAQNQRLKSAIASYERCTTSQNWYEKVDIISTIYNTNLQRN